jgi:hypothetical protein
LSENSASGTLDAITIGEVREGAQRMGRGDNEQDGLNSILARLILT